MKATVHARPRLQNTGFRLPSCLDNRPLRFDEFEERIPQFIYTSATPGDYEERVSESVVEQIIRRPVFSILRSR